MRVWIAVALLTSCAAPAPVTGPEAGPANARGFSFSCDAHTLRAYEVDRSLRTGKAMPCHAHVADRLGRPVKGATVAFYAEAGTVDAKGVSDAAGDVTVSHAVGLPLPRDVEPAEFQRAPADATHLGGFTVPLWMQPQRWIPFTPFGGGRAHEYSYLDPRNINNGTGPRLNPRDNLVRMIAVVAGEEAFDDQNGNGTRDEGEAFDDQLEPFVDANDDGTWSAGELFVDVDQNGRWDGRNGVWDANGQLWTEAVMLWTGVPGMVEAGSFSLSRDPRQATMSCSRDGSPLCAQASPVAAQLNMLDPWLNGFSHQVTARDSCQLLVSKLVLVDTTPAYVWSEDPLGPLGLSFNVTDARAGVGSPVRSPPAPFEVTLQCTLTDSLGETYVVSDTLPGTIE